MSKSLKCVVISSDNQIISFINKFKLDIKLLYVNSIFESIDNINNTSIDVCIIDIEMLLNSKIDLFRNILKNDHQIKIIFIAKNVNYAYEAFKYSPVDYIVIPKDIEKLRFDLLKLILEKENNKDELLIRNNHEITKIVIDDIIFVESDHHYQNIYFKEKVVTIRMTSKHLENVLLQYNSFVRTHSSYLVNINKIKSIKDKEIEMESGDRVEISKRLYKKVKEIFLNHYQFI